MKKIIGMFINNKKWIIKQVSNVRKFKFNFL